MVINKNFEIFYASKWGFSTYKIRNICKVYRIGPFRIFHIKS